ncbi:unannotated protein [freshwater metagenome]|uniref:Unannotated protein n=1 Tax=freshwater metagenome TaxID=449393 RepID=A0A6J7HDL5_9ZZZZ
MRTAADIVPLHFNSGGNANSFRRKIIVANINDYRTTIYPRLALITTSATIHWGISHQKNPNGGS